MTMTKISSKKTCYTYGHDPLINLSQHTTASSTWTMFLSFNPLWQQNGPLTLSERTSGPITTCFQLQDPVA